MPNTKARDNRPIDADAPIWEPVNRIVFPIKDADLTMPLYAVEWQRPHLNEEVFSPYTRSRTANLTQLNRTDLQRAIHENAFSQPNTVNHNVFAISSRISITVKPGKRASLCTFFNAFPASYWRRWTNVSQIRLSATVCGKGSLTIVKSNARGLSSPVTCLPVNAPTPTSIEYVISLRGFLDGGLLWLDLTSDDASEITLRDAVWAAPRKDRVGSENSSLSIAITTFNRPSYCLNQLLAIAGEPALRARLDTVYCTDQGTDLVRDQTGFAAAAKDLGNQLTYQRQRNIGGSGGFTRGMYETVKAGNSDYVLLLDDDAISEPESIVRALNFADYTKTPTLVGGGMFHLDNRTIMLTLGEHWDSHSNMHGAIPGRPYNHDFAQYPLSESPEWHQRFEADYNAWWMCLIPTAVIKSIGLGLPLFIKHDDIEFGLRARKHGFRTVALPGVAVWHQAWHDKDPLRTWEEYFVLRNRWIQGLLYCDKPTPRFLRELVAGDVNAGCKLAYSAMKLRNMAMRDLLRGPQHIIDTMPEIIGSVRQARQGFADSTVITDLDSIPNPKRPFAPIHDNAHGTGISKALLKTFIHNALGNANGLKDKVPDVAIPYKDVFWTSFRGVNSALVTTPDGDAVEWFRRDSKLYRRQLAANCRLYAELLRHWERYAKLYRKADMTSFTVWESIFRTAAIED